jgi:hypothetical protein
LQALRFYEFLSSIEKPGMRIGFNENAVDHSGWLAGLALWAFGAAASVFVAVFTSAQAMGLIEILFVASLLSAMSLALRLPVLLCSRVQPNSLVHAMWLLGAFAQLNWAGFLAVRSANGMVAFLAISVCLATEAWATYLFLSKGRLNWLQELSRACLNEWKAPNAAVPPSALVKPSDAGEVDLRQDDGVEDSVDELIRITRDAIDENGSRYLSGTVHFQMPKSQRTETIVLSFCPPLDAIAEVDLETDCEEITAKVEHVTESGARLTVRRQKVAAAGAYALEWFARAGSESRTGGSTLLP